jgi:hypothetical protein
MGLRKESLDEVKGLRDRFVVKIEGISSIERKRIQSQNQFKKIEMIDEWSDRAVLLGSNCLSHFFI